MRQQRAAQIESELAGLKGAYQASMNGYDAALERLPQQYATARNALAANSALGQIAFNERAAASGLNTGAAGQAALSRSSTLQRDLANIDTQESNAVSDVELQKSNLTAQYETAIAQSRANGNAELAQALYQELVRVQGLDREDAQIAQQTAQQAIAYLQQLGITPDAELLQTAFGINPGTGMGTDYSLYTPATITANYNNGGLTAAQIREMQNYYGVTADGLWGEKSKQAAGGKSAKEAWNAYQAAMSQRSAGQLAQETIASFGGLAVPDSAIRALLNVGATEQDIRAAGYTGNFFGGDLAGDNAMLLWELKNDRNGYKNRGYTDKQIEDMLEAKLKEWVAIGKITSNEQSQYLARALGY